MRRGTRIINRFILSLIIIFIAFSSGSSAKSAEINDSTVFVEAFNAYQQKDYLLAIEKCDLLNQVFPDSPLRDVTLLLIARASLKSGDIERAVKSIALFSSEFPESSLKISVEDELNVLASRHQKGEVLSADKALQSAARKVSSDRMARERATELKMEMEHVAKAKAEQECLARIKLEAEYREKERLQAEQLAKESMKVAITLLHEGTGPVPVGGNDSLAIEISNVDQVETGKRAEINLDVNVREDSAVGQELRGHVEVLNGSLQRNEIFTASSSVVQAK